MIKDKRIGVVIIFLIVVGVVLWARRPTSTQEMMVSPTPSATPVSAQATPGYASWKLFRNGYAFPLPPDWKNTSDTNGTATFVPGQPVGNIDNVAVTVLPDAKAPQGQRFTTQTEFDRWYTVQGEVQGDIQKLENIMIDGEKAIILSQKGTNGRWMVIIWARHQEINLYITASGVGEYGAEDATALTYMAEHFTFTAPPMTEMEDKE